jgi:hypothetical protein
MFRMCSECVQNMFRILIHKLLRRSERWYDSIIKKSESFEDRRSMKLDLDRKLMKIEFYWDRRLMILDQN